jgi:hypothetical protein
MSKRNKIFSSIFGIFIFPITYHFPTKIKKTFLFTFPFFSLELEANGDDVSQKFSQKKKIGQRNGGYPAHYGVLLHNPGIVP